MDGVHIERAMPPVAASGDGILAAFQRNSG
jgi:hypothetical protein